MDESRKKAPVIIELDELELADVVGGANGAQGPDLTPGRCPAHQTIDRTTAVLAAAE